MPITSLLRAAVAVAGLMASGCAPLTAVPGETVELLFWARPGAERDPRVIEVRDHCCCSGKVALARLAILPTAKSKGTLQPELVVELSGDGSVIRRWPIPVNLIVAGIKGDEILVPLAPMVGANYEGAILISAGGGLSRTTLPRNLPKPVLYSCPHLPEFEGSDYVRCFQFRELASGTVRRLAFEGPCTLNGRGHR